MGCDLCSYEVVLHVRAKDQEQARSYERIAWHPNDYNVFATASSTSSVYVWNVQQMLHSSQYSNEEGRPTFTQTDADTNGQNIIPVNSQVPHKLISEPTWLIGTLRTCNLLVTVLGQ